MTDPNVPTFAETLGSALLDAARINVMAARAFAPPEESPVILLPGDEPEDIASLSFCLEQAGYWLDQARVLSMPEAPTSFHVVGAAR